MGGVDRSVDTEKPRSCGRLILDVHDAVAIAPCRNDPIKDPRFGDAPEWSQADTSGLYGKLGSPVACGAVCLVKERRW